MKNRWILTALAVLLIFCGIASAEQIRTGANRNADAKLPEAAEVVRSGDPVTGAVLQVVDQETKEVMAEWISGEEAWNLDGILLEGRTYLLREIAAPDGYLPAEDIAFTVTGQEETEIVMADDYTKVWISKQSMTDGKELAGAVLQLFDDQHNLLFAWTTTGEVTKIEAKLKAGATYYLREITAPEGYEKAEEVSFTVREDGEITRVVMKDREISAQEHKPQTGDETPAALWVVLAVGFLAIAGIAGWTRRCRK